MCESLGTKAMDGSYLTAIQLVMGHISPWGKYLRHKADNTLPTNDESYNALNAMSSSSIHLYGMAFKQPVTITKPTPPTWLYTLTSCCYEM